MYLIVNCKTKEFYQKNELSKEDKKEILNNTDILCFTAEVYDEKPFFQTLVSKSEMAKDHFKNIKRIMKRTRKITKKLKN